MYIKVMLLLLLLLSLSKNMVQFAKLFLFYLSKNRVNSHPSSYSTGNSFP